MDGIVPRHAGADKMTSVWLVTNDGSGDDGDDWLLKSIHATEASAKEAAAGDRWHRCVEEWKLEGPLLTVEEREAVRFFSQIDGPGNVPVANKRAATLRALLERTK